MQQDSVEKAYRMYDLVTKIQPANPAGYYNRGVCNEMLKKLPEATVDYRRALMLDTGYQKPKEALKRLGFKNNGKL
jgi:Tfp pilus assembly protein PilF